MLFDLNEIKKIIPKKTERSLDELIWALTDPIVLHRSPWASTLPQWIKGQIITERLISLMTGELDMATDTEAMAYIYPASLDAPLDHDWTQIYLYVTTKTLESTGKEVPPDVRVDDLDNYKMSLLRDLKRWIYKSRSNHRVKEIKIKEVQTEREPLIEQDIMPLFAQM